MPKRIQRKRAKGWRMPPGTVYVGRPTKWGNLYATKEQFQRHIESDTIGGTRLRVDARAELRDKNLCCWCPLDKPCHADVLLKIANGEA